MVERVLLTYADVDQRVRQVAAEILDSGAHFTEVYGVPRGGCVPAALLAHHLNADLVEAPVAGTLVVDDLVDSGDTAAAFAAFHFVALYAKPWSPPHGIVPPHNIGPVWVTFPWEIDEDDDAHRLALRLLQVCGRADDDTTRNARVELLVSTARS